MRVVYGLGNIVKEKKSACVVTVGVFDGVHRGHKKILAGVVREAGRLGVKSIVVTFAAHPTHFFHPSQEKVPSLTSLEHKLRFLKDSGIDVCCVLSFDRSLARMSAEYFIEDILSGRLGMVSLYVGEDFVFGRGGSGDTGLLKRLSKKLGFSLRIFRHLKIGGRVVSSTLIREFIKKGDLRSAQGFLGRRVSFMGDVAAGERRGRVLGFPTANIRPHHEVLAPDGIYACEAFCGARRFFGLAYLGIKPTFKKNMRTRSIEVYLLGLNKDIYGKKMEVQLIKKIRNDKRFPSADALIRRMKMDVSAAKKIFHSQNVTRSSR